MFTTVVKENMTTKVSQSIVSEDRIRHDDAMSSNRDSNEQTIGGSDILRRTVRRSHSGLAIVLVHLESFAVQTCKLTKCAAFGEMNSWQARRTSNRYYEQ